MALKACRINLFSPSVLRSTQPTLLSSVRFAGSISSPHIFKVSTESWKQLVEDATTPVIVDAKADWCGPCKVLGPRLEKAVASSDGVVKLAILDVEESPEIAGEKLSVMSIPAVFAFHKGKMVDKFVGNIPEPQLQQFIQKVKSLK